MEEQHFPSRSDRHKNEKLKKEKVKKEKPQKGASPWDDCPNRPCLRIPLRILAHWITSRRSNLRGGANVRWACGNALLYFRVNHLTLNLAFGQRLRTAFAFARIEFYRRCGKTCGGLLIANGYNRATVVADDRYRWHQSYACAHRICTLFFADAVFPHASAVYRYGNRRVDWAFAFPLSKN